MTRLWPQGQKIQIHGGETLPRRGNGETLPRREEDETLPRREEDETSPAEFVHQGQSHRIVNLCNRWRIHVRWWEPGRGVCREYLKVTTDTGLLCLIYHELPSDEWYLARIYD